MERAEAVRLNLAATHVAVAGIERAVDAPGRTTDWVEQAARARFAGRGVLVTVKDRRLVCVLSGGLSPAGPDQHAAARQFGELAGAAAAELAAGTSWRVGVRRSYPGPLGVFRGYRAALETVTSRTGWACPTRSCTPGSCWSTGCCCAMRRQW